MRDPFRSCYRSIATRFISAKTGEAAVSPITSLAEDAVIARGDANALDDTI